MRYRMLFLLLLSTTLAEAAEIAPPDLSGKVQQAFCWSSHNDYREPAIYFSDVFEIRVPKSAGPWYSIDMAKVFAAHLSQEHGYVSPVPLDRPSEKLLNANIVCSLHDTAATAQATKDLVVKNHAAHKQPVVETGWRMSAQQAQAAAAGASANPPAATAAAPTAAPIFHGFCVGSQDGKQYFSALFSAPMNGPTTDSWVRAYTDHLAQKYGFQGTVRCDTFDPLSRAQLVWDRQTRMASSFGPARYIETGWKYAAP